MASGAAQRLCGICGLQFATYTCPRCGLAYCSVPCYRAQQHGDCAEGFFRREVETQLHQKTATAEQRREMLEILKRVYAEHDGDNDGGDGADDGADDDADDNADDADDDHGVTSLDARLGGIDLDDTEAVWARLTAGERRQFERLVATGKAEALLVPWEPWWTGPQVVLTASLVETAQPAVPTGLPPLVSLLGARAPARELPFHLVDLLFCYVLVMRFTRGEPDPAAACDLVLDVSAVLGAGATHQSTAEAAQCCMARAVASARTEGMTSDECLGMVRADVAAALLADRARVSSALAGLHELLQQGKKSKRCQQPADRVKAAVHKAYFHLVWWHNLQPEEAAACCLSLALELANAKTIEQQQQQQQQQSKKPLIQVIEQ